MAKRFEYSRWDGTQTGFEFDAVPLEQPPDRVVMTLLAGGDVAKDGHPPCLVEAPVHVAGESVPSSRLPG